MSSLPENMARVHDDSVHFSARRGRERSPTRSRSRARREVQHAQHAQPGESLEHLVRGILEYALQLFVNGSRDALYSSQPGTSNRQGSGHERQWKSNPSRPATNTNEIVRLVLSQVVKYAMTRYMKSRKWPPRTSALPIQGTGRPIHRGRGEGTPEDADAPRGHATTSQRSPESSPWEQGRDSICPELRSITTTTAAATSTARPPITCQQHLRRRRGDRLPLILGELDLHTLATLPRAPTFLRKHRGPGLFALVLYSHPLGRCDLVTRQRPLRRTMSSSSLLP